MGEALKGLSINKNKLPAQEAYGPVKKYKSQWHVNKIGRKIEENNKKMCLMYKDNDAFGRN